MTGRVRSLLLSLSTCLAVLASGLLLTTGPVTAAPGVRAASYVPVQPCKVFARKVARKAKTLHIVGNIGKCRGIPADVVAVTLAVSARKGTRASSLKVWPGGTARPATPVLAWSRKSTAATTVPVKVSANGAVRLRNAHGKVRLSVSLLGFHRNPPVVPAIRTRTVNLDPSAMMLAGSGTARNGTSNGCATNSDSGGAATGTLPLPLPVGARLRSVTVITYDGSGTDSYEVRLNRMVPTATGLSTVSSRSLQSGGDASIATRTTSTELDEILGQDESLRITMSNLRAFNNGLCQVRVTYDITD